MSSSKLSDENSKRNVSNDKDNKNLINEEPKKLNKEDMDKIKKDKLKRLKELREKAKKDQETRDKIKKERDDKGKFKFNLDENLMDIDVVVQRPTVISKSDPKNQLYNNDKILRDIYNIDKDDNINEAQLAMNLLNIFAEYGCSQRTILDINISVDSKDNKVYGIVTTNYDKILNAIKNGINQDVLEKDKVKYGFITLRNYSRYLSNRFKQNIEEELLKDIKDRKYFKTFNLGWLNEKDQDCMTDAFSQKLLLSWKYEMMKVYLILFNIRQSKEVRQSNVEFKKRVIEIFETLGSGYFNQRSKYRSKCQKGQKYKFFEEEYEKLSLTLQNKMEIYELSTWVMKVCTTDLQVK